MFANNTTINNRPVSSDLNTRILIEASKQQDEQHHAELELTASDKTRRARHWSLVNACRKFMMAADVVEFYSRRYNGVPATAPYTLDNAKDDICAALDSSYVDSICRPAIVANLTGDALRKFVASAIAQHNADKAARRQYNAALLAQVKTA